MRRLERGRVAAHEEEREMEDVVPVLVTYSYAIGDGYYRVAQPSTGTELFLSGSTLQVFKHLVANKGQTFDKATACLVNDGLMTKREVSSIMRGLVDHGVLELKRSGGW